MPESPAAAGGSDCPAEFELLPLATGEAAESSVRAHVAACNACRRRIESLKKEVAGLRQFVSDAPTWNEPASTAVRSPGHVAPSVADSEGVLPNVIGRYRVVAQLADSGQARVFRVIHPELAKDLVLKLSHRRTPDDPAARDRLVEEGRLLAELDHPNMARIVDLDFCQGRAFMVMEFIRGRTLRQVAKSRKFTPQEAAALVAQIARALAPAHARGILHQDIKPDNIIIDEQGRPRIIDFGLALLRHAWADDPGKPGTISGTIRYMAPEQARGETEALDVQCDVFALGGVLFALLTGRPPFDSDDDNEALALAQRCQFDHVALRAVAPRRLAEICLKAMSERPLDRHRDAAQLAAELEAFVHPPVSRRWLTIAALVLLACVAVWVAWVTWPRGDRAAADVEFQNLIQIERRADDRAHEGAVVFSVQELAKSLPVREDDTLSIEARMPSGLQESIVWFKSDGSFVETATLKNVDLRAESGETIVTWPSRATATPSGVGNTGPVASGTDFVLVCGDESRPSHAELQTAIAEAFGEQPLPELPASVAVVLKPDGVGRRDQDPHEPVGDPALVEVEAKLDQLRRRLTERYPFFVGVAFPVRSKDE